MWIYEYQNWPSFTWSEKHLKNKLDDVTKNKKRIFERIANSSFEIQQEMNINTLTLDIVESSAIEGEHLASQEVRSSIARRLGINIAGAIPASRNVEGVVEMMLGSTQRFSEGLTTERLFGWHAALFPTGRSGMHWITTGRWRSIETEPMQVISGPFGREKVHFEAPNAAKIPQEMEEFLKWFEGSNNLDPVIKAGIAHLWFITIHPFEDGNGRIARAITDMALARADGMKERFYSLSSQIAAERKHYYNNLESQQRSAPDITNWLSWFIDCLGRSIDSSEQTLNNIILKANIWNILNQGSVNERQRLIINRMLEDNFEGFMSTSKYAKIAKCSNDTALRDITELKDRGVFIQNPSKGRSTSYKIAGKKYP